MNREGHGPNAVLHVCGDFAKQRIYPRLVTHLTRQGVAQVVYAPVRTEGEADWNSSDLARVQCHFRHILSPRHRVLFRSKVTRVVRDIVAHVDLSEVRLSHAHFLYSDGAVALALKRRFGLPYIVAVRNTDINAFMRYRPDLRWIRDRVLWEASRVVLLSPAYEQILERRLSANLRDEIRLKTLVIPNGVEEEWLIPPPGQARSSTGELALLYVGDFSKNKNLPGLLEAASRLARTRSLRLTLVGGGGGGSATVERLLASGRYPFAKHVGRVEDPSALREIYRDHDVFVMVSTRETFGVVYIEALSQGLPIVHTRGQGVDGYFAASGVAEAASPRDPAEIAAKIEVVASRLPAVKQECVQEARRFGWNYIANTYAKLYGAVMSKAGLEH